MPLYESYKSNTTSEYIHLFIRPSLNEFSLVGRTKNMSSPISINLSSDDAKVKALFDKKYHNIVITFGQSDVKMYIDGVIAGSSQPRTIVEEFIDNTPVRICNQSNKY